MYKDINQIPDLKFETYGIRFVDLGEGYIGIQEMSEDDDWYDKGYVYSANRIEERIKVLKMAKDWLDHHSIKEAYGYKMIDTEIES